MKAAIASAVVAAGTAAASAQIRVVTYNTLDGPNSPGDLNFRTVFNAIPHQQRERRRQAP